ncbi:GNAT family N-acetyltransferase [Sinorhizobium sp. 8-89]|uniref:GNAT family N-acetyltransferase n=1 Tax=Sinorhizobium sp. 7-81 TaxID=3049087 RepID=UPI0024C260C4|nr:GNAT family N-acetyltransferase [Sinorhizobium sp. 7-81]MDK1386992.1 GNAT family N-acetyltransferase [Sinorhizobium sp. 7-81]
MTEDLSIRPVVRSDYDRWLPLWEGYNAFYGRLGETALTSDITLMTWSRFFDAYEPMHALVAESKGRLIGLTHYIFHRSTTSIQPNCYLQDLFINDAARGNGVGQALINGVFEAARRAGSPRVYWLTHESNIKAMRLYDKVAQKSGFVMYKMMI